MVTSTCCHPIVEQVGTPIYGFLHHTWLNKKVVTPHLNCDDTSVEGVASSVQCGRETHMSERDLLSYFANKHDFYTHSHN
jgi:hypothetical protein